MVVGGRELIDTLWNVNKRLLPKVIIASMELIDTLWNVNENPELFRALYDAN